MPPLQHPTVDRLVDELVSGERSLEDVAAEFSRRDWSVPAMTTEMLLRGDEEPPRANYWEVVEAARQTGRITEEQYETLDQARGRVVWHQPGDEPNDELSGGEDIAAEQSDVDPKRRFTAEPGSMRLVGPDEDLGQPIYDPAERDASRGDRR